MGLMPLVVKGTVVDGFNVVGPTTSVDPLSSEAPIEMLNSGGTGDVFPDGDNWVFPEVNVSLKPPSVIVDCISELVGRIELVDD